MLEENNATYKEIVSPDDFAVLEWFYKKLLPETFKEEESISPQASWKELYRDWNYPNWIHLYEDPLTVIFKMDEMSLGIAIPTIEKTPKEYKDLFIQLLKTLKEIYESKTEPKNLPEIKEYLQRVLIQYRIQMHVGFNQLMGLVKFHVPVPELMQQARNDDTEAMYKLVKLDKSFLQFEPIAKRVRIATLFNEDWLLKKLSFAMKNQFSQADFIKRLDDLAIYLFWHMGFCDSTIAVFNDFLGDLSLMEHDEEKSLKKRLHRLGLKKFSKNS